MSAGNTEEAYPPKSPKLELVTDILAAASVITAFLFLSHTFHYDYFEALFGLTLSSGSEIALIYLLYSLLIAILKVAAVVARLRGGENEFSKQVEGVIGRSLFSVTAIAAISILTMQSSEREVSALCYTAVWVLVAELNLIFCGLLKKVEGVQSLALFGWTIEALLVVGQLGGLFGFDFFHVL